MTVAVAEVKEQQGLGAATAAPGQTAVDDLIAPPPAPSAAPAAARHHEPLTGNGGQRRVEPATNRVRRDGKFFRLGTEKFFVKGVTYGPFALNADGDAYADLDQTRADFEQILSLGANCVRVYHNPPAWFLNLAHEMGVKVFVDVAWPKNLAFVGDEQLERQARDAVRDAARLCGNHPAVFAISVV